MKQTMTHNDNVRTFEDISRRVELEVERLEDAKTDSSVFAAESVLHKTNGSKRERGKGSSAKNPRDGSGSSTTKAPKRKSMLVRNALNVIIRTDTWLVNALSQRRFGSNRPCREGPRWVPRLSSSSCWEHESLYGEHN